MSERIERLRVEVDAPADPHLLAAAIRRRLAGGPWPAGPERTVADAVVAAHQQRLRSAAVTANVDDRSERSPWR